MEASGANRPVPSFGGKFEKDIAAAKPTYINLHQCLYGVGAISHPFVARSTLMIRSGIARLALIAFVFCLPFGFVSSVLGQDKLKGSMDRRILQNNPSSGRFYNERGSVVGRSESRNGSSRFYDSSGRTIGRAESRGDSTRFFTPSGSAEGRAETRGDQTRFYDRTGRSTGSSKTSGNSTRFYSPSGSYQGRSETRNGTTRYYDSSGRLLGSKK